MSFSVYALVEMIADEGFGARRGIEETFGSKEHPTLGVGMNEESQAFSTIASVVPAERAVAQCGHNKAAIGGEIHGPTNIGNGLIPEFFSLKVEQAQIPFSSQHKTGTVLVDGKPSRDFVLL